MKHWRPHDLHKADSTAPDAAARRIAQHLERQRARQQERDDQQEDLNRFVDQVVGMVIDAQQAQIKARLDTLAEANTKALLRNSEEMEAAQERLKEILTHALVLPDGRRVFRTEDGTRVIDEHGQEVLPEIVDPASIGDERPTWEEFERESQNLDRLEAERERLLEQQEQIDQAREDFDEGNLSAAELDALEADLGPPAPSAPAQGEPPAQQPTPPSVHTGWLACYSTKPLSLGTKARQTECANCRLSLEQRRVAEVR